MTSQTTTATDRAIYSVCVGSGAERFLMLPEDGHVTLSRARDLAQRLRIQGYRSVYILDHVTGQSVR